MVENAFRARSWRIERGSGGVARGSGGVAAGSPGRKAASARSADSWGPASRCLRGLKNGPSRAPPPPPRLPEKREPG